MDVKNTRKVYFWDSYLGLRRALEEFDRMRKPPWADFYYHLEKNLRRFLQLQLDLQNRARAPSRIGDLTPSIDRMLHLFDKSEINKHFPKLDLRAVHSSWWLGSHRLEPNIANVEFIRAAARLNTGYITRQLAVSEKILSGFAFDSIARSFPKLNYPTPDLKSTLAGFTASFRKLLGPISGIQDLLKLPEYAVSGASREVFLTAHAISKIPAEQVEKPEEASVISEATEESSSCIELLREVDPALTRPYVGAHDAMRTGSSDRARHVLISLREFWDHLLRRLAPEEEVLEWIPETKSHYLHKGKPTRAARFSYVCRNIDHKPLREFVQHDSRMYSLLFELFQRVHDLRAHLSDEQLKAIVLRSDSMLLYVLKIYREPI